MDYTRPAQVGVQRPKPLLQKQGDLFVLEVENPLVIDHLRAQLQRPGLRE